jgi:hypothetical protein
MRNFCRAAMVGIAGILSAVVALSPGGYLNSVMAQASGFIQTFDGTPATPAPYTNPNNWDIFVQGFTQSETGNTVPGGDPRGGNIAQHGPNCEAPGFPYTATNSHVMRTVADSVFICNGHLMTSPGLSGYGAIYMTPPAVADFSAGAATITWEMSTLRSSGRDWVDVVLTPWVQQSQMAYNNNDQHIPPNNIHISLAGTNAFIGTQRIGGGTQYGQGTDTPINGDGYTTWDQVFAAQNPALVQSATRRDTFQITLSRTTISVCMPDYSYGGQPAFCWMRNAQLPQALDPAIWNNQASVQFDHRVYNAEKACIDNQVPPPADALDQFNIDHSAYGDRQCPNDTWHWSDFSIAPSVPFAITKSVPEDFELRSGNAATVNFQSPSVAGGYLTFVALSHTPDLAVSYDGGASWRAPHIQPSIAPNNGASEENGEAIFDPMPAGVRSVVVRGSNGFWGSFGAQGFHLIGPPSGTASNPPTATPTRTPTTTSATATPTTTSATATPTRTATPPPVAGGGSIVTFDSLTNPNRVLSGAYPNATVNWGTSSWWLASAYDRFTSNSVSFNGPTLRSAVISLSTPARLTQLDANNGGSATTTVTLSCAGQPTITATVAPHQASTIRTSWTGTCSSVTVGSANGWETNFDNLALDGGSGAAVATSTPTRTAVPAITATSTPTRTATPAAGSQTVSFDTATGTNVALNGQYPTGLINWGTNTWLLSGPVRSFGTKSISFISAGPTSAPFTFVAPHRLVSLDAFNDGTTASTITLSCAGQTSRVVSLAAGQLTTITTGWTGNCTTVTIASTNGWYTNFDNLRIV